jgi:dethiobiotin synthetase
MAGTRGVFVTGTDTGVGKTLVSTHLLRTLRDRGVDVGAMKPIETGVGPAGPLDAIALHQAAGRVDPLDDVCPVQLALPAAPNVAAAAEATTIGLAPIREAFERLRAKHHWLLVEGAGGLLVPILADYSMIDLAQELALPLLLVARARLGTINHTLLSLAEIERRGLELAGVVICHADGVIDNANDANLTHLRRALGPLLLGEVPVIEKGREIDASCVKIESFLENHISRVI